LAEILRTHGYVTGAVVSNFSLRRGSGFDQGFYTYDDQMDDWSKTKWEGMERLAPKTTKAAIAWLTMHAKDKLFLWVHFMDPHYPYLPPPPYNTMFSNTPIGEDKWLPFNVELTGKSGIEPAAQLGERHELQFYISQYDGEIRSFDHSMGELLQTIRALGLMDKTLIILAADHGEGMGEHDYYFAHHEFLYQELIHVPLLVRFPDHRLAGHIISYPVANVDILPTILETLTIDYPETVRGRHLLSPEARDIYAVTFYRGEKAALIASGRKLIENNSQTELYDLEKDPDERMNLAKEVTDEVFTTIAQLKQKLEELVRDDRLALGAPVDWNIDAEAERKLKALGYVQ
jgi:arylsulfatase A-like enzyme